MAEHPDPAKIEALQAEIKRLSDEIARPIIERNPHFKNRTSRNEVGLEVLRAVTSDPRYKALQVQVWELYNG